MKKIAVIQDLSGLGKCSLTAAIPVISVMGVQAVPLPTAVLSNQTGYSSYYCDDYTDRMGQIMDQWEKREFHPDGIYTGFLAGEKQADQILQFYDRFCGNETLVLVDPVMGDNGKAYGIYTEGLRERLVELAGRAQVITPNLTEALLLLYGGEKMEQQYQKLLSLPGKGHLEEIKRIGMTLMERFSLQAAVITGIEYEEDKTSIEEGFSIKEKSGNSVLMGNLVVEKKEASWYFAPKRGGSYSGTGDLFASVLSAGLVQGLSMKSCVEMAVNFLGNSIQDALSEGTDRNDGVCFEKYLWMLARKDV